MNKRKVQSCAPLAALSESDKNKHSTCENSYNSMLSFYPHSIDVLFIEPSLLYIL